MNIKISEERLNDICFPVLDEVFGVLTTPDNYRFYDEMGNGRILIRKNKSHITFGDFKKLMSSIELNPHIWGIAIKNWLKYNFGINVNDEFVWLTWSF